MKGKNKLVPRLLGITKESVMRVDEKTKEVIQEWNLTNIKRWAASPKSFTLVSSLVVMHESGKQEIRCSPLYHKGLIVTIRFLIFIFLTLSCCWEGKVNCISSQFISQFTLQASPINIIGVSLKSDMLDLSS